MQVRQDESAQHWNGPAAEAWAQSQGFLDEALRPFEKVLVDEVVTGSAVLDIGCGAGATTLATAEVLGPTGRAIGVDISEPLIALARTRAEQAGSTARFVLADAQTHPFPPGAADLLISRFGVMFFPDPPAAFANLRRAARPGGTLRAIVWRDPAENPFMTTAERAAAPLLPDLPPRSTDGPGQFALADRDRVHSTLTAGGWAGIDVEPLDVDCAFPEPEAVAFLSRLGPVGMALREVDEPTRARVVEVVRAAFAPYVHGDEVRFNAACWLVRAHVPG